MFPAEQRRGRRRKKTVGTLWRGLLPWGRVRIGGTDGAKELLVRLCAGIIPVATERDDQVQVGM